MVETSVNKPLSIPGAPGPWETVIILYSDAGTCAGSCDLWEGKDGAEEKYWYGPADRGPSPHCTTLNELALNQIEF